MKAVILCLLNLMIVVSLIYVLRKPGLLTYNQGGRIWLTWISVRVITLMDELTSVFYAPAEAYRFIGPSAIVFIAFTAVFVHYMTTRLVEIAEILEHHKIFGGGVYSFSYLVLGPTVSFIAVSSIMVDYILTACISAVSAVENANSFIGLSHEVKMVTAIIIVWLIAGLNIIGIKENARFTFLIFLFAAVVFLNLIASGILALDDDSIGRLRGSFTDAAQRLDQDTWFQTYGVFIASIASCVLAYSGVESVLQTAGLVRTWREIAKSYFFLAFSVGIVTPIVAALALSSSIDFHLHEGDLITHYATIVNGAPFGIVVAALATFALIMAVNTAFVASSELIERVAHRYGFAWIIETNRNNSLHRIHLLNAFFFSTIIIVTQGSQMILADMYALGLIASFCINMGALLIYRYFMGTKEVIHFNTSRTITLLIFLVFVSCFAFLSWHKPHGTELWAGVTGLVLVCGLLVARTRAPEIKEIAQSDSQMHLVLMLAESTEKIIIVHFQRPREENLDKCKDNEVYVTFFNPRRGAPQKMAHNHFRFPFVKLSIYQHMLGLLKVIEYELADRSVIVRFGWPLSSWVDRLAIGVMVFNIMRLPRIFPRFKFEMTYPGKPYEATPKKI